MSFAEIPHHTTTDDPKQPYDDFEFDEPVQEETPRPKAVPIKPKLRTKIVFALLIGIGLMVHTYDLITDIIYVAKTDFDNDDLFRAAVAFIVISPVLQTLLAVSGLITIYSYFKQTPDFNLWTSLFWLKAVGALLLTALGLFDVIFLVAVIRADSKEVLETFHFLSKSFCFISALFESLPQIIVVMVNNYYTGRWTTLGTVSIIGSSLAAFYDSLSCIRSFESLAKIMPDDEQEGATALSTISRATTDRTADISKAVR